MIWTSSKRTYFAVVAFFLLLSGSFAFAQSGTTSLRGTVSDKSGAAIVGARVILKNIELNVERVASSGPTGQYEFIGLPPGTYTLSIEEQNFQKYVQNNLQLLVNSPTTQDVVLQIGSSTQTVEVLTQTETLNTTDASIGTAFNESRIKQLPLEGRNIPDLLTLQSGVVYTGNRSDIDKNTDTRSGAVNGARSDQSNLTLDGVDVNDQVNGYAFT